MRLPAIFIMLWISAACHRSSETHEPVGRDPAVATIVVHGVGEGWTLAAAPGISMGNGGRLGSRELPSFQGRLEQDRLSVECLLDFRCSVGLTSADGVFRVFEVVTAAPIVEVQVSELSGPAHEVRPRYLQPQSRAARVATLLEKESALVQACRATVDGVCGGAFVLPDPDRVVPGHDPREALARLRVGLTPEDEALATWVYFNVGCPRSPGDAELARLALGKPIEPLARNLWPVGIARAIIAAEGREGAEQRLAAMRAPAERELAAATLLELLNEARGRHDLEHAASLHEALRSGDGPWKGSPLRESLLVQRGVVGAALGSIPLRTLTGELRDVAELIGAPFILYAAASWCAACHRDGLPELRSVAAKHPELAVLFVLWDDAETAESYVAKHAPIPGTVVLLPNDTARAKLEVVLGVPSFPSFVVVDSQGRVAAIAGSDDLDTVVQRSGVLADR